jgi:GNAT superfamily N-acetyltransferase
MPAGRARGSSLTGQNKMKRSETRRRGRIRVRRARVSDIPVLVDHRRVSRQELGDVAENWVREDRKYAGWLRPRLRDHEVLSWVCEEQSGKIVGSGCLWLRPTPRVANPNLIRPHIFAMYTERNHRGRGIASAIVKAAIEWCKRKDYERITLNASEKGRNVYARQGFEQSSEMRLKLHRRPGKISKKKAG